jgi:hypothetical protein
MKIISQIQYVKMVINFKSAAVWTLALCGSVG